MSSATTAKTAALFVLSGVSAQKTIGLHASRRKKTGGIAADYLLRIIGNTLWDWHNLWYATRFDEKPYAFGSPADLRWVPRFTDPALPGATAAIVEPKMRPGRRQPVYDLPLTDDWFVDIGGFVDSRALLPLGEVTWKQRQKRVTLKFPPAIDTRDLVAQQVTLFETNYWRLLTEIYATVDQRSLAALSACRNPQATTLSIAAIVMSWWTALYSALYEFRTIKQCYEGALAAPLGDLEPVRNAVIAIEQTLRLWAEIDQHIAAVRQIASLTELHGKVPTTHARSIPLDCNTLLAAYFKRELTDWLVGITLLATAIDDRISARKLHRPNLGKAIRLLAPLQKREDDTALSFANWTAWLRDERPEIGTATTACQRLLDTFAADFLDHTGLNVRSSPSFYEDVLIRFNPLEKMGRLPLTLPPGSTRYEIARIP